MLFIDASVIVAIIGQEDDDDPLIFARYQTCSRVRAMST